MSSLRLTLIVASSMLWVSFWLSNWDVHWLGYLPATMLMVAGIVGFCPSTWIFKKIGFKASTL